MIHLLFGGQAALFFLIVIALVISLSFHEFGHAFTAKLFGDDTAQRMGRLTLNPLAHIDPMGLLMVVFVPPDDQPQSVLEARALPLVEIGAVCLVEAVPADKRAEWLGAINSA
ncbi:MAG: site-2 protease family protein, partial [SAR324 cluster bacterium]|nr:site-2 protease family protein [SAR324 cluster bacterium]